MIPRRLSKLFRSPFLMTVLFLVSVHALYFGIRAASGSISRIDSEDSREYLSAAENIRNNRPLYAGDYNETVNPDLLTRRPPVYPLFIATITSIVRSPWAVLIIQNVVSVITAILLLHLWHLFFGNRRMDIFLIPVILLYPAHLYWPQTIYAETLFQALVFGAFVWFIRFVKTQAVSDGIAYNTLLGLAALTKPVLYLFWIPNLVLALLIAIQRRRIRFVLCAMISAVIVFTYSSINYFRTGYFHFSSNKNIHLSHYNAHDLLVRQKGAERADEWLDTVLSRYKSIDSYAQRQHYLQRQWKSVVMRYPWRYFLSNVKGVINFFIDPGRYEWFHFLGFDRAGYTGIKQHYSRGGYGGALRFLAAHHPLFIVALLATFCLRVAIFVSFVFWVFAEKGAGYIRMMAVLLVGYVASATGPLGASRYAYPVVPIMLFPLPFALSALCCTLESKRAQHAR
jgi:hypothetical protein